MQLYLLPYIKLSGKSRCLSVSEFRLFPDNKRAKIILVQGLSGALASHPAQPKSEDRWRYWLKSILGEGRGAADWSVGLAALRNVFLYSAVSRWKNLLFER